MSNTSAYNKAWYQKNKERIKEKRIRLYHDPDSDFKEKTIAARNKWRENNLEKHRKYCREYNKRKRAEKKAQKTIEIKIQTEKPSILRRLLTLVGL